MNRFKSWSQWKEALLAHYTTPLATTFQQFRLGAMLFFLGLVVVYIATQIWEPSLEQEVATAVGLVCAGAGFIYALMAQMRMMISRFVIFFKK